MTRGVGGAAGSRDQIGQEKTTAHFFLFRLARRLGSSACGGCLGTWSLRECLRWQVGEAETHFPVMTSSGGSGIIKRWAEQ